MDFENHHAAKLLARVWVALLTETQCNNKNICVFTCYW